MSRLFAPPNPAYRIRFKSETEVGISRLCSVVVSSFYFNGMRLGPSPYEYTPPF
ncbi:uncharacterized protein PHALS_13330 [Plasmopara halstedii]|uniref:Uncharacterized protein n=1 Tax=Plasmopara halstedii TaxID=4781 RepID=A0A0P1APU5_PLAHL|nr:uncharacterized protein PHALS_13330 [Plasmopara halstedii]CEG43112.1 hypothetical protein PHALS_13330 [Plasmopara halstedii]|eukprot:XP_024579481.1 hypothetical protein PHALS_13330 [Plasmopara halstedii]